MNFKQQTHMTKKHYPYLVKYLLNGATRYAVAQLIDTPVRPTSDRFKPVWYAMPAFNHRLSDVVGYCEISEE